MVPNIKNAQDLSLKELALALNELATTARAGKTQPAQMQGGTLTVTNIGALGHRHRHADHQPRRGRHRGLRHHQAEALGP